MSTSTSLPWRVGWSRHLSAGFDADFPLEFWGSAEERGGSCEDDDDGDAPWGVLAALRLAKRDSMYAFLND